MRVFQTALPSKVTCPMRCSRGWGGEREWVGGGGRGRERQGREGERGEGGRESFVYVCVYVCVCVRVFVCVCPGASHVTASEAPKKKQKVQELCIYKTK
jgi:hypothetical protein